MDVILNGGEVIEPLDDIHKIIQPTDGYRFGGDAVALSRFASQFIKRSGRVFDLCSGCGIIGILIALERGAHIDGAEIDGALCSMSNRSAAMNGLDARFLNIDIRELKKCDRDSDITPCSYDAVVCNPPYYKRGSRLRSVAPSAVCELTATFNDVAEASARLVRPGGNACFSHICERLDEVMRTCSEFGLTPKNLTVNANCKTFLLRTVKGGKPGLTVKTEAF